MSKIVQTAKAPAAIGPYSQGVCVSNLLFISGQLPIDPKTGNIPKGIRAQTVQVMENLKAVAEAAGADLKNTVITTCYLSDMSSFTQFNDIYADYFTGKPARSCVAVEALPKSVLVEVMAVIEIL